MTDLQQQTCPAAHRHPVTDHTVQCTREPEHLGDHCHDVAGRLYWPRLAGHCPNWTAVPTAQGNAVLYCVLIVTHPDPTHRAYIGLDEIRWQDTPLTDGAR